MPAGWQEESYQNAADDLEVCVAKIADLSTDDIRLLPDAYEVAFPEVKRSGDRFFIFPFSATLGDWAFHSLAS